MKKNFLLEILGIILMSLAIVVPVRYFLIQPFVVKGASMEPNFHNGEYLIINEIGYRFKQPERGDVIVFKYPNDPDQYYIKRIVGLPNETVKIKGGRVTVYNSLGKEEISIDESEYLSPGQITKGETISKIGENEYFVLGDNRDASSDSRNWGTLSEDLIIGRTWIRAFPFDKFTIFRD